LGKGAAFSFIATFLLSAGTPGHAADAAEAAPLAGASTGSAAPTSAPDVSTPDKDLQLAKDEFEAAQLLFVKEQFDDAAARFLAAYTRKTFPAFLFNAAVSFEKAKKLEKAEEFFQKYLDQDPKASDAEAVRSRIAAIRTILAPPAAPAAAPGTPPVPVAAPPVLPAIETKGLVVIDSKPAGATIYLNDKKAGAFAITPWHGSLPSTPVKVILEAKGFKAEERTISPRSDKLLDVYIALSEEHFLGWVEIVSSVPGSDVFIDKKEFGAIGKTPYTGHLKPGTHLIFIEKAGYKPAQTTIEVAPGTASTHAVTLERSDNGWVTVAGRGAYGAKVSVDGKPACTAPCQQEATPGLHRVLVEKEGYEDYEGELKVEKGAETVVEVQWSPRPSRKGAWTAAALAAVSLGGGIYAGLHANQIKSDLEGDLSAGKLDSRDPRFSQGKLWSYAADGFFGLATVLAVSSVISFLSHGPDSTGVIDQRAVSLAPTMFEAGGGFAAVGRF
jgi:hypothetical protein